MPRKIRFNSFLVLVSLTLASLCFCPSASAKEWKTYTLSDGSRISLPEDWKVTLSKEEPSSVKIGETILWDNEQPLAGGRIDNKDTMFTLSKKWFSNSTGAIAPIPQSLFTTIFNAMNSNEDSLKHITKKTRSYQRPYGEVKSFSVSTKKVFIHKSAVLHNNVIYLIRILSLKPINDADTLIDKILNRWDMDPSAPAKSTSPSVSSPSSTSKKDWRTYNLSDGSSISLPADWRVDTEKDEKNSYKTRYDEVFHTHRLASGKIKDKDLMFMLMKVWISDNSSPSLPISLPLFDKIFSNTNKSFEEEDPSNVIGKTRSFERSYGQVKSFNKTTKTSFFLKTAVLKDNVIYDLVIFGSGSLEDAEALVDKILGRLKMSSPAKSTSSTTTKGWKTYKLPGGQLSLPSEWKARNTFEEPPFTQTNGKERIYMQTLVGWEGPLSALTFDTTRIWLTQDGKFLTLTTSALKTLFEKLISGMAKDLGGKVSGETRIFRRPDGELRVFSGRAKEAYYSFSMLDRDGVLYCIGLTSPQPMEDIDSLVNAIYDRWQMEPPSF